MPQARGEVQPLQKKQIFTPAKWQKNLRVFDESFGGRVDEQQECSVPECTIPDCKLDCKKLTIQIVQHARDAYREASLRGIDERQNFLNSYARPSPTLGSPHRLWGRFTKNNVQPGRNHWRCTFCKCNPGVVPAEASADTTHMFK